MVATNDQIIAVLESQHEEVVKRLDRINGRLDKHDDRLDEHSSRIAVLDTRQKAIVGIGALVGGGVVTAVIRLFVQ